MGRGQISAAQDTDVLYGDLGPRTSTVETDAGQADERCVIVIIVDDAGEFEHAILEDANLVPDLDHIKSPTETVLEVTINASVKEARRQLTEAAEAHAVTMTIDEFFEL